MSSGPRPRDGRSSPFSSSTTDAQRAQDHGGAPSGAPLFRGVAVSAAAAGTGQHQRQGADDPLPRSVPGRSSHSRDEYPIRSHPLRIDAATALSWCAVNGYSRTTATKWHHAVGQTQLIVVMSRLEACARQPHDVRQLGCGRRASCLPFRDARGCGAAPQQKSDNANVDAQPNLHCDGLVFCALVVQPCDESASICAIAVFRRCDGLNN